MAKFRHTFTLSEKSENGRVYKSGENTFRIDFISESAVRVALYKSKSDLLPTFSVNPDNAILLKGRDKLSLEGFGLCAPEVCEGENEESFCLPCGIEINLNKNNFLLEYLKGGEVLFADRAPLAYNLGGEFGDETYHYITRREGEHIFGLGDKGGALDKSGRAFKIATTDCMGYNAESTDPLYKHIPFYICENSTGTYGIFYDTSADSYMDFGKEINNYYPLYKHFKSEDKALVYYVFFGTKLSVLKQFSSLCGKQAFPPKWSFDYCASTMAYTDAPDSEKQFDLFLEELKKSGLSCGGFYLSSGYTTVGDKRCVFNWDKSKFPNPEKFVKIFKAQGIEIIPNIKPAFLLSHPLYGELKEKGYFIKDKAGEPFVTQFWDGLGSYLDFTNPAAFDFWKSKVKETLLSLGINATWNDNNEFDIRDCEALTHLSENGEKARLIKPDLTYLMVTSSYMAQTETEPELRPFLSTRSGGIGVRRMAQTWSGDNRTLFKDLRFCHNIGLTMSMSGLYFYGHDLGGFTGAMPSRELLLRWLQHGVFEPRFTVHSWNEDGSATMPWTYPDILPAVKKIFSQRKRLMPYLYNCAYNAAEKEIPINSPPLLFYDDEELYSQNDTMLFGTDILVPFVFDEGISETKVYLPKMDDWYLGENLYNGGQKVKLNLPAEQEVPLFIKAGSIIPTDESGLIFTVYPKENDSFKSEFFDDDGRSFEYKNNHCVKLEFLTECDENTVSVKYKNVADTPIKPEIRLITGDGRNLVVQEIK